MSLEIVFRSPTLVHRDGEITFWAMFSVSGSPVPTSAFSGSCLVGGAIQPRKGGKMKNKELTATLAHLRRLLADPRLETAYREKLRKGTWELEKIRQSGKLDPRRIFRATSLIASTLVEMLPGTGITPTPSKSPDAARKAR